MIEIKDLSSIIPHSGKMLLLSCITEYNLEERNLEAEYNITESCIFFDPAAGGVPSWVGFECIAQAIAALSGIENCEKEKTGDAGKKPPRIGFILSISKMQVLIPVLKSGCTVIIKVKELDRTDMVFNFEGQIFLEGTKALEGTLTVMEASESMPEETINEN
ncbi:MAG: 3-hydroxylacyl-ACP dehydratase [Treponema sp.]|nr:3-hydroxylacyl-ACP dehydratase [Treponema sp.]